MGIIASNFNITVTLQIGQQQQPQQYKQQQKRQEQQHYSTFLLRHPNRNSSDAMTSMMPGTTAKTTRRNTRTENNNNRRKRSSGDGTLITAAPPHDRKDGNANDDGVKKVTTFLESAVGRFQQSYLQNYPDFHDNVDDYPPIHPTPTIIVRPITSLTIIVNSTNMTLYHTVPENYTLRITPTANSTIPVETKMDTVTNNSVGDVSITLHATTVFGIVRGLETLGQLLDFGWMEQTKNTVDDLNTDTTDAMIGIFVIRDNILPLYIYDAPSFAYRGVMIDTARHYLPIHLIVDNLNIMAMNKFNILHWHLSDTQSFPYASRIFPELSKHGAFHPNRVYTVEDIQYIVHEAYLRGIRVIPEIDMPGHTYSIGKSHPELMSRCPHPNEPINPTIDATYTFLEQLYEELILSKDAVFNDEFVHVGGDEVQLSDQCWLRDPSIVEWMKIHNNMTTSIELYEYFETQLFDIITKKKVGENGRVPIVWQEVYNNLNASILPSDTIIDVWKGFDKETIQNATLQKFRVIISGCWYLDHLDQTWEKLYNCDPLNYTHSNTNTDTNNKELVIGGHASMWGEHVDASNFISRVWPRASAVAERLWSGSNNTRATTTITQRIHMFRCRMVLQGYPVAPIGPGCCPTEVKYISSRPQTSRKVDHNNHNNEQTFEL